jgi:hypothetical protein
MGHSTPPSPARCAQRRAMNDVVYPFHVKTNLMLDFLKNLHSREKFADAFEACQQNAWAAVRKLRTTTLPILTNQKKLNPYIQPGCTVRIWSTETLAKGWLDLLKYRNVKCKTVPVHLCVEIIPRRKSTFSNISFSLGYGYESEAGSLLDGTLADWKKGEESSFKRSEANKFKKRQGVILTPDPALNEKLGKQYEDERHFLYLVAIGNLTQAHIDGLQEIISSSTSIRAYNRGNYFTIQSPKYLAFQEYSNQRGQTRNCTSFVLDIFEDLLRCRGATYFIANPAWCRAKNLSEDFPGCDENGLILRVDKEDAQEPAEAQHRRAASREQGLGETSTEEKSTHVPKYKLGNLNRPARSQTFSAPRKRAAEGTEPSRATKRRATRRS